MSDSERYRRSSVGSSMPSSGWWWARTPIEPTVVRVETISTSSLKTSPSGVRTSTLNGVRAISPRRRRSRPRRCRSRPRLPFSPSSAPLLASLGLLGLGLGLGLVLAARAAAGRRDDLVDAALHEEGRLGQLVVLAVEDLAERAHGLVDRHVDARRAGELLGHVEGLAEEALDLARALDGDLVLVGELVDAEDGDDVLQLAVALQGLLDLGGDVVVLLAHDVGLEDRRGRVEGVDGRVDALLRDRARERRRRVEVREDRGRCRVGEVVGRDVDGLDRRDRALARGGDALLQLAHLGLERRLVAHLRGHAAQQRGDLRAGLHEAEDVVDEEQHVLTLLAEVLRHGQARQRDAHARARAARSSGRRRASSCR